MNPPELTKVEEAELQNIVDAALEQAREEHDWHEQERLELLRQDL